MSYFVDESQIQSHLELMMDMERQSGEFLLASVVHDSLLYSLNHHAGSESLEDIARHAARITVSAAAHSMGCNPFTVAQSVRGVMHTMLTLGGDVVACADAVSVGSMDALRVLSDGVDQSFIDAVSSGICDAIDDMGHPLPNGSHDAISWQ